MDAQTREWIVRTTNDYLHETIKFGRKGIGEYGLWLYRLKNDADFKAAGDILFQAARKGRKTGDWEPLPSLRYWVRPFLNEYKAIRDHRARRAAR
jgi:hypothetical protein